MRMVQILFAFTLGTIVCTAAQETQQPKPAGKLPVIKELPNPFTFANGSPVRNAKDWQRRRGELKEQFQDYVYGHMPPRPEKMIVKRGKKVTDATNKVTIQRLEVILKHKGKTCTISVTVALPESVKGKVPVLIRSRGFGFGGGTSGRRFKRYTDRGYAVAEFRWSSVAGDNRRTGGIYALFGDKIDTGTLMGWAWGISRVIDALQEAVPEIDPTKVFVTGHSRNGKAVLLAGAFDERIALTVPSHSGCAGVAPFRFIYGRSEQLHNIAGAFPNWFRPDFKQFARKVDRLPVDQHLLVALVAPRAYMSTEGTKDSWTNPQGAQLTYLAAKKVYDFLKASDKISIRYRPVGHIPSTEDLLAYADYTFFGKALPKDFGRLPYKKETKGFTWDVPK